MKALAIVLLVPAIAGAHLCNRSLSDQPLGSLGLRTMVRDQCGMEATYNASMVAINEKLSLLLSPPSTAPRCGDGTLDEGEDCDPPGATDQCAGGTTCSATCTCPSVAVCGNGVVEGAEQCDGAGQAQCASGETCSNCTCVQVVIPQPACGNGTIETPELCDPGGNACTDNPPTDPSCGQSGTCTDGACAAANGLCTNGCTAGCTCAPLADTCPSSDYYVDPTIGSDGADGSSSTPFKTVQKAMDTIGTGGGKTVCVNGGTSRETVTIPGDSITIQGVQGATIDGGTTYGSGWTQSSFGGGRVWQHTLPNGFDPGHMTLNEHYVVEINPAFVNEPSYCDGTTGFDQTRCWKTILEKGPRSCQDIISGSGCAYVNQWISADAMFAVVGSTIYMGFADGATANGRNITLCGRQAGTYPWATISEVNKDSLTLKDITVRGCDVAIYLGGGTGHLLDRVVARNGRRTILATATSNTYITNSDVSIDYGKPMAASDPYHYNTWHVFRDNGIYPRTSIEVGSTGSGNVVSGNIVHDCFDGITDGDGGTFNAAHNVGFQVYNNVVTRCANDAFMERGGAVNAEWYDNRNWDTNQCFRIIIRNGPAYIYRNRCAQPEPSSTQFLESNCFYLHQGDVGTLKLYHNSCHGLHGVVFGGTTPNIGAANYHIASNIFSTQGGPAYFYCSLSCNQGATKGWNDPATPKATWEYNWHSKSDGLQAWMTNNTVAGSLTRIWEANILPSFQLPEPDITPSPRNCGLDVSATHLASGRPWPGYDAGYYALTKPDCGWTQYATPAPTTSTTTTSTPSTTTTTSITLPDWTTNSGILAHWNLDQESDASRTDDSGNAKTLTNAGTVAKETTLFKQGTAAATFASAGGDYLTRAGGMPAGLHPTDFGVACWVYATGTGWDTIVGESDGSSHGFDLRIRPDGTTSNEFLFQTYDTAAPVSGSSYKCGCTTAVGSAAPNTWYHIAGIVSSTGAGSEMIYKNGIKEPCTYCDNATTTCTLSNGSCTRTIAEGLETLMSSEPFQLGNRNNGGATVSFDGTLDDCMLFKWADTPADDNAVDPQSLCRICSCGLDGTLCTCGGDGTVYATEGRRSACNNCTLPPCDQATP